MQMSSDGSGSKIINPGKVESIFVARVGFAVSHLWFGFGEFPPKNPNFFPPSQKNFQRVRSKSIQIKTGFGLLSAGQIYARAGSGPISTNVYLNLINPKLLNLSRGL